MLAFECEKVTPVVGRSYDAVRFVALDAPGLLDSKITLYADKGHGFEQGEVYQVSFKKREPLGGG